MTEKTKASSPILIWDVGTAYEFFVSLHVLHTPESYGLRAPWAAGIRSRIPAAERKFLEDVNHFLGIPVVWVTRLPNPKDAISAQWALKQLPAEKRLGALMDIENWESTELRTALFGIAERRSWNKKDQASLITIMEKEKMGHTEDEGRVAKFLDWWARPEECGEMLSSALQAYYQVFFQEEEKRLLPVLKAGLEHAQELSEKLSAPELIAELSQGLHVDAVTEKELLLIPAYWTTPLVVLEKVSPTRRLFLFGARPASMSAVPGEFVPDALLRSLKALADPTRLRILYYLTQEEVTPSELARRLHLRAPTVTHHLNELRLAGLVNLTFRGQEKLYRSRLEAIDESCANLKVFLQSPPTKEEK